MPEIRWNALKSKRLKKVRGVSFEEIIRTKFLGVREHPVRANRKIFVYEHRGYIWAVPYVENGEIIFLKTIYPSRKLLKIYKKEFQDEKD